MEFIAPHAGTNFTKIAEPKKNDDTRKLSFTNCTYLIAY